MRAILCREHGGPEGLVLADLPVPDPGACHVGLRVRAAGLNFADLLMLRGKYQEQPALPFVPGLEVAGEDPVFSVPLCAVGRGSVCERVAREKSSKRSRSTTVRPTRPALRIRRVTRSTRPIATASISAGDFGERPSARCEPIEPRRRPG